MKLTYNEILFRKQVLENIPVQFNGHELSRATTTSLLILRAAYQKKSDEYEDLCRNALEDIKKGEKYAGFDEMAEKRNNATRVLEHKKAFDDWKETDGERPVCPSDDEIAAAETVLAETETFDTLLSELTETYNETRIKQLSVETTIDEHKFTRSEIEDLVGMLSPDSKIKIRRPQGESEESSMWFLQTIVYLFA